MLHSADSVLRPQRCAVLRSSGPLIQHLPLVPLTSLSTIQEMSIHPPHQLWETNTTGQEPLLVSTGTLPTTVSEPLSVPPIGVGTIPTVSAEDWSLELDSVSGNISLLSSSKIH